MLTRRRWVAAPFFAAVALGGCSDTTVPAPELDAAVVAQAIAPPLLAAMLAGEGFSFFDNFAPCPRRGVMNFHAVPGGRRVRFVGCESAGVTFDGTADVLYQGPSGADRLTFTALAFSGDVTASDATGAERRVRTLHASDLVIGTPRILSAVTDARIEFDDVTRTVPGTAFHSFAAAEGIVFESLPNPGRAPAALEARDVRRIALHAHVSLAALLLNELLETQRGEHEHDIGCGVVHVIPTPSGSTTRLKFDVQACDMGGGLFIDGRFEVEPTSFSDGTFALRTTGPMTIGGGVPVVTLTATEWSATSEFEGETGSVRIRGELDGSGGDRAFDFTMTVDD